ncbi:MAG: ABC transporter ATP-binding protein [Lentisphaeria bacterium]
MSEQLLKAVNLQAGYGRLRVLNGASLHVDAGEVVALLGVNGAGKSTLLRAVAGLLPVTGGRLFLAGAEVTGQPAERLAGRGLLLVPEGRGLFPDMTVLDNLRLGGHARRLPPRDLAAAVAAAAARYPVLQGRLRERAGNLSGGQQQMLALARAQVAEPRLLLLDEPSTGLAPQWVSDVFAAVRDWRARGAAVLLAEQNMAQALAVADRGYVLENGQIVLEGTAAELLASPAVRKAYLGGE